MKRVWMWIVGAAAAVAGVVILVLTGHRKTPSVLPASLPLPPPPPEKPLVALRPADDYAAAKAQAAPASPPDAVITRINARHGAGK